MGPAGGAFGFADIPPALVSRFVLIKAVYLPFNISFGLSSSTWGDDRADRLNICGCRGTLHGPAWYWVF
jgi:hypothetical protein